MYWSLRARWDRYVPTFAAHMAHDLENFERVGCDPAPADERQEFRTRVRAAG